MAKKQKPTVQVDPVKLKIAQHSAQLFLTQTAGVPADVQLMAIEMLAATVFQTGIKKEHQLRLLDPWLKSVRDTVLDKKEGKHRG